MSKVSIVATMGPASRSRSIIRKMIRSGLAIGRLNFSHGTHEDHLHKMNILREIGKEEKRKVKILQDLEGYRIRVGRFKKDGVKRLLRGKTVWLTRGEDEGDPRLIPFDYTGDFKSIGKGQPVYIDDGNIILETSGYSRDKVKAEVVEGGILKERKGINMPGVHIPFSGITEKDKRDMEFGIKHNVDFIAQSFVRTKEDIEFIKKAVRSRCAKCRVIAKIESREAIKNIDEIIDVSDGIMVARGDMGVAIPIYEIPVIQKLIIRKCNYKKKFVITATQMLEHMTEHKRPTRAEVTDVANAILDGTDYVMLSEETAAGSYPVESVVMMRKIIDYTERHKKVLKQYKRKAGK